MPIYRNRVIQWTSDLIQNSPTATIVLHRFLDDSRVHTGNPANVQHLLKTQFHFGSAHAPLSAA